MASHDPKQYADLDFYDLLGLNSLCEQKDIDAAWRRFALKHHPDKVGNAANKKTILLFHSGSIGRDILSDPAARAIYDNARIAKLQEQQRHQVADEERQQHINNLLRREAAAHAAKQPSDGYSRYNQHGQEGVERIKRVRGHNMALMEKYVAHLQTQQREAKMARRKAKVAASAPKRPVAKPKAPGKLLRKQFTPSSLVPLSDRTLEAQFRRTANTQSIEADEVKELFSIFGTVEAVEMLTETDAQRLGLRDGTKTITCMVAYESVYSAFMAVTEWREERQKEKRWNDVLMVNWISKEEPSCVAEIQPVQEELTDTTLTFEEQHAIRIKKLAQYHKAKKHTS